MDETINRSPVATLRSEFRTRTAPLEERVPSSDELLTETDSGVESSPAPSRRKKQPGTLNEFSGSLVPAQFKLPADLVQSLKLHAIDTGETMSDIVLRCMTSADTIAKAWISTRNSTRKAS
jgi:hypothetical protein